MRNAIHGSSEGSGLPHKIARILAGRWRLLTLVIATGALATTILAIVRKPHSTAITRGQALSVSMGCVGCHGPSHIEVRPNPGSVQGEIPPLRARSTLAYYVQSEREIKEWILYGAPERLRPDGEELDSMGRHSDSSGLITMPAYNGFLSEQQLADLVAYTSYVAELEAPSSSMAKEGRQVAERLGCFACHGIDGRGALANPGSFKGIIPPWDGKDFAELVRDERELRQWLTEGMIDRFESNPLAMYFVDRQVIKMPAYRDLLGENELNALVAYINWLRDDHRKLANSYERVGVTDVASRVQRGEWLYQRSGCATCHGREGRGGVPNRNAVGGFVPALNTVAERVGLFEEQHVQVVVEAIEAGDRFEEHEEFPGIPDYEIVLMEYRAMRSVMLGGARPMRRDASGPEPPMQMPSWEQRVHADFGPISDAEFDALLAYLLTLQPWDE